MMSELDIDNEELSAETEVRATRVRMRIGARVETAVVERGEDSYTS